ncbi:MAG: hypothetical protein LBN37_04125, partial [Bacteroidales bacterium]|nr:hypothetical protein [Bacteroidales bacterium]
MKTILKNIFRHLCRTFFLLSVATGSAFGQSEALPAILLNESGLTLDSAARIAADKDIPFADKITMVRSITKSEQFNWHHEVQIKWVYTPLLEEAKQQKDNKMLADFYVSLSAWYVEWRWFKEAHAYLDSATVYLDDVTDPYILGNIHYIKGTEINFSKDTHSPEVIEQYNKAIDCLKQSKEYAGRASIRILYMTNHIAEYYSIINDTAKLKKYIDLLQPNSTNAQNLVYYRWLKAQSLINYYTILNDLTGNVNYRDSIIHHCWNSIRNADSLPEGMSWLKREITLDYLRIVVQTLEKDDLSNVNKLDSLIKEAEDIDEQKLFTT